MKIIMNGVERQLSPELSHKLLLICNEQGVIHADMVMSKALFMQTW